MTESMKPLIHHAFDPDVSEALLNAKVIGFDLDGTLASSRAPMSALMASAFERLLNHKQIAIITGGRFALVEYQVLSVLSSHARLDHLHIMPVSGSSYRAYKDGQWQQIYGMEFSVEQRKRAINSLMQHAMELGLWFEHVQGLRIDDRGSQITFSAFGQDAPRDLREHWDPDGSKRLPLAQAVAQDLPDLQVKVGGTTSIDIALRGIDKAFAVHKLCEKFDCTPEQIVFIGDRMNHHGNDFPAAQAGTFAIEVANPGQTLALLESLNL